MAVRSNNKSSPRHKFCEPSLRRRPTDDRALCVARFANPFHSLSNGSVRTRFAYSTCHQITNCQYMTNCFCFGSKASSHPPEQTRLDCIRRRQLRQTTTRLSRCMFQSICDKDQIGDWQRFNNATNGSELCTVVVFGFSSVFAEHFIAPTSTAESNNDHTPAQRMDSTIILEQSRVRQCN